MRSMATAVSLSSNFQTLKQVAQAAPVKIFRLPELYILSLFSALLPLTAAIFPTLHPLNKKRFSTQAPNNETIEHVKAVATQRGWAHPDALQVRVGRRGFAHATGFSWSWRGPVLSIAPEGQKLFDNASTKGAFTFLISHELAHIEKQHMLWLPLLAGATSFIVGALTASYFAAGAATLLATQAAGMALCTALISLVSCYCEREADLEAIRGLERKGMAKNELLKVVDGAIAFFKGSMRAQQKFRYVEANIFKQIWRELTISEEGDSHLDLLHPYRSERLATMQAERDRILNGSPIPA